MSRISVHGSPRFLSLLAGAAFALSCGGDSGTNGGPGGSGGSPSAGSGGSGPGGSGGMGGQAGSAGGTGGSAGATAGAGGAMGGAGGGGTGGAMAPDAGGSPGTDAGANPDGSGVAAACQAMIQAANAFIASIEGEAGKRADALLDFDDRRHFKYTPGDRPGLPLMAMSMPQREAAMALVKTGLSTDGFNKAENVRALEIVLDALGDGNNRNPLLYFLAIYGTPSAEGDWAWHWEGHHLSLHYTVSKCNAVADAPSFYGANPAQVPNNLPGGAQGAPAGGTRVLGEEEDVARMLAMTLSGDDQKRAMAIVDGQLREVQDSPNPVSPANPAGLAASAMSPAEQEQLKAILAVYAENMSPDLAAARLKRIQDADFSKVTFLWSGSLNAGQAHYYRIQGPTFLIEYLNQQGGANHIHSVWRDFNGDFGVDLLQLHLESVPH